MGTSSSGSGPGNNSPLNPNWDHPDDFLPVKDPTDEQTLENIDDTTIPEIEQVTEKIPITGNWGSLKATLGRIANGSKNLSYKGLAKRYIKNLGGVGNAVRSSRSGISGGLSFASFLGSIGQDGLNETLKKFGLADCIGKSAEEVFAKISDKLFPAGNTNEEAITRKALLDTLGSLYEKFVENDNIKLDNLQEHDIELAIIEYTSYYIYNRWLYELGLAIENKQISEIETLNLEEEIRQFIFGEVRVEFKGKNIMKIDFTSGEGKKIIEDIFKQSYTTLIL